MIRAIDVSRWQGAIDWHAVKADGVQAAWIKVAGSDDGLYRDGRARDNLANATAAGIPFGTYYYFLPGAAPANEQAQHAVGCGHGTGDLWPMIDVEANPHGLSLEDIDRNVTGFCNEVQRLTGRESIVYTYSAAGLVGYTPHAPSHCRLWIANYGSNQPGTTPPSFSPRVPPAWSTWDVWQFNARTPVAGIAGSVDQNVISDDMWQAMTGAPSPSPMPHEEDHHMDTLIIDTRDGRLSAWLLSGRFKTWVPGIANGGNDFPGLLEDAARTGRGDLKIPPDSEGGVLQGGGSPWILRLDLAQLTNPEATPVELGGQAQNVNVAEHADAVRAQLEHRGIDPG